MKVQNLIHILMLIVCAMFLPKAQAVSPAPDGGYPGGNTAEGQKALQSTTTGGFNAAVGYFSLFSNSTGSFNTALGAGALDLNTADNNTAVGAASLLLNTSGSNNTAIGVDALALNNTGSENTATGALTLSVNTTGQFNTAAGFAALNDNTTGSNNTAIGNQALIINSIGNQNTAVGSGALFFNTSGGNTASGYQALFNNTTGIENTAVGHRALESNTTANSNTATGTDALSGNIVGAENTADGASTLASNTGSDNTATGFAALNLNTTGNNNTAIGFGALNSNTTGSGNIAAGFDSGLAVATANNVICIGANLAGANVSNTCFIRNIHGVTTINNDAIPVVVDSGQQLGTVSSSRRYKTDIEPLDKASESILALKPVSFRYKVHNDCTPQYGLIAEEVADVNPNLVIYDADGKPYTVRYDAVNAVLLNEFLKEHRTVQQQQATITELKSTVGQQQKAFQATAAHQQRQIEALTTGLQKLSAQLAAASPSSGGLEASKFATGRIRRGGPVPQVVNNP